MPTLTQTTSPLARALNHAIAKTRASFAPPGHKRSPLVSADPARMRDLPLLCGVEDQALSRDFLGEAERLAARAWGAEMTRFSVQGSTGANLAAAMSVTAPDMPVIVARTSHKSVLAGLVLSGARPHWLLPEINHETGLALGIPLAEMKAALSAEPTATAVWLPDPTYVGVCSDLEALAALAHAHSVPVVVDQAWGAHFGFHPAVPKNALALGADISVISAHKTLTAFTQGSMLHVGTSPLVAKDKVGAAFDVVHTTSLSGVILASLDDARALMEERGEELLESALALARELRSRVQALPGVACLEEVASQMGWTIDPLKIAIDVSGTGISGLELERQLRNDGIQLAMADAVQLVPVLTICDGPEQVEVLLEGLTRALENLRTDGTHPGRRLEASIAWRVRPTPVVTPRAAFLASHERVSWRAAAGRIAAEMIVPYPPGVPAIAPGEELSHPLVHGLRDEAANGARIIGPSDASLETFLVLAR